MVACCDIAVAADSAVFGLSEVRLGIVPAVISPYVVAAIGPRNARRFFITGERFAELAGTLFLGILVRQASREVAKFVPFFGSVVSAGLAGAATFALGKAMCFYFSAVHKGHTPKPEELKRYYDEQLVQAEKLWRKK